VTNSNRFTLTRFRIRHAGVTGVCWIALSLALTAIPAYADDGIEFSEQKIRPVLVKHCYQCHSSAAAVDKKLKGELRLDSRDGTRAGGDSGPAVVPGKPGDSLLISSLRHESLTMPPKGKLPDEVIVDFVKWVEIGAPDPRDGKVVAARTIDLKAARKSWAFQRPRCPKTPSAKDIDWPRGDIDRLVLANLEANGMRPAPLADKRTLIRRASYDLLGLPPTAEEIEALPADDTSEAFANVVERMLDSPEFGVR